MDKYLDIENQLVIIIDFVEHQFSEIAHGTTHIYLYKYKVACNYPTQATVI